jgi:outer membrane murein-binding lipoprotein Lpp
MINDEWQREAEEVYGGSDRKVADAAGQVRVAEAKLGEIRNKENATASQKLAAEETISGCPAQTS